MYHAPIVPAAPVLPANVVPLSRAAIAGDEAIVIRLLRHWVAAQQSGTPALPAMIDLAAGIGTSGEVAIALDSLLALTQACLERPLRSECCCSTALSGDELAVLLLIGSARVTPGARTSRAIPHGLPGVLAWAAAMVRARLADDGRVLPARRAVAAATTCPFAR
jgi:hypothetical protein